MDENHSRARILGRIRAALDAAPPLRPRSDSPDAGQGAAPIFAPVENPLERFRAECEANRTELRPVSEENEGACLKEIFAQARALPEAETSSHPGESGIFAQDAPVLRRLIEKTGAAVRWSSQGPPRASDLAAVTLAEALVARTGSVLITTEQGGRTASVLPPLHIVYADASQIVSELGEALRLLQTRGRLREVSLASVITGPSRTSDIEKMLVLGAHGPRRLVVLLRLDSAR